MNISSIKLDLPCCSSGQETNIKYSLILRTITVGVGVIVLLIGSLALCEIPNLSALGTTGGGLFSAAGVLILLASACLRYIDARRDNGQNTGQFIDFAAITPENYERYLDVTSDEFSREQPGNCVFKQKVYSTDSIFQGDRSWRAGDVYLEGWIVVKDNSFHSGVNLEIRGGQFVHYPQLSAPKEIFSNLKDFFDYLFRGDFYQGEGTKSMPFFTLRTVDGREIHYNNPYLSND